MLPEQAASPDEAAGVFSIAKIVLIKIRTPSFMISKKIVGAGLAVVAGVLSHQAGAQTFAPLGTFVGGPDRAEWAGNYAAFQTSMGQGASSTTIFIDYTQTIQNWPGNANYSAGYLQAKAPAMKPIVSVGLTDNAHAYVGGSWNETNAVAMMNAVAAGSYDAYYAGVINNFKNHGFTQIYLRIGWEQNGGWYGWYATKNATTAAAFVAAFQHVADLAHNLVPAYPITGVTVKTVWCPVNINWTAYPVTSTYPGDSYVDVVGPDCYSNVWPSDLTNWGKRCTDGSTTAWAADPINRTHFWDYPNGTAYNPTSAGGWGLLAGIAFAKAHGKPFGLSECGAGNNGTTTGPSDEAEFPFYLANRLSSAIEQGVTIEFVDVWDVNASGTWNYSDGTKPKEEAAWYQFVGTMAAARPFDVPFGVNYTIGTVGSAGGGTGTLPGPITLQGGGAGYVAASTADNFNFIAQPISGDGSFVMQLASAPTITSGQAGVMLRGGMRAGDPYAALYVSGSNCIFASRTSADAASVQNAQVGAGSYPIWLKLERVDAAIIGYKSSDGKTWSYVGSQVVPISINAYIGAAIGSGSASTVNTAALNFINQPNDVIVDNSAATKTGTWGTTTSATLGYGGGYYTDNNANKTVPCTVTYTPNLAAAGNYDIYAWYTPGSTTGGTPTRANNVPVTVTNANGSTALVLDESSGLCGSWNYVGTAAMVAGTGNAVTLSNTGTTDYVVADALRFVFNPAPANAITGSVTATSAAVNLSPAGIVDWGHWGGTTSAPSTVWDHANLATPLISNWTAIGTGGSYGTGSSTTYRWTGSAGPNATATDGARAIYRYGVGSGFQFTVTTGATPRLLNTYVGQNYVITSQFRVLDSLSNVVYSNSMAGSGSLNLNYTVILDPNDVYTVQYTETAGTGNINLQAATLTNLPPSP
jgi:hypothetical protein